MSSTICASTPELCSLIVSHLITSESVAVYATVSREWRLAVERHTFSTLQLNQSRLADFTRIVTGPRRRAVRRLRFDIVLDAYSIGMRGRFETREEQERNNEVFTEAIHTLFGHLSSWSPQDVIENGIELVLKAYSPSDPSRMERDALMERDKNTDYSRDGRDLLERRFLGSFLKILTTDTTTSSQQELLPVISIITKLMIMDADMIGFYSLRRFWPASAFLIASKLPRLVNIDFVLWDSEKKDLDLRKRARNGFTNGLPSLPSSVRVFKLRYSYFPPSDQTFFPPNIIPTGDFDRFSTSLRIFSQQLTSLILRPIVISSEFFWPLDSDLTPQNTPYWPHLTSLYILYTPVTPYGKWLFERNPAEEVYDTSEGPDLSLQLEDDEIPLREDWDTVLFREVPNARLMNDWYLAAGRALAKMPRLKKMVLAAQKGGFEHSLMFQAMDSKASLKLWSTPRFEPEVTVLDIWREAAKKNTRAELEIIYLTEGKAQNAK